MTRPAFPDNTDLRELLRFHADSGQIWLGEHRMVLMHTVALAALRKELIESLGPGQARRVLTRMGFASGMRDAEIARQLRNPTDFRSAFVVGPQLHMLQGSVQVEPVQIDYDPESGHFAGEFLWHHSWEAAVHRQEFGEADEAVCWMQIGYASGYTSAFVGQFIMYREVACAACGDAHCRIVGKPVADWPDAERDAPYFEADSIVNKLLDLRAEVESLRHNLSCPRTPPSLIGSSPGFRQAYDLTVKAAATSVNVLLLGETGVGKERFARALHDMSPRRDAPFVAVNCAALPHDLIESELFGVERGAYTGAHAARAGRFERAHGGTLFLDEVGELPLAAQAKLLRVLQEGEFERLGDEHTRRVDVRVVAATHVNLQDAVAAGRFRADLFYRLDVYPITLPPLRERVADIPALVAVMLGRFCTLHDKRLAGVTEKAMMALQRQPWPGNVRELENLIERGVILAPQHGWIGVEHLFMGSTPAELATAAAGVDAGGRLATPARPAEDLCAKLLDTGAALGEFEHLLLQRAVERTGGNRSAAARLLGLTRPQLDYRLKKKEAERRATSDV